MIIQNQLFLTICHHITDTCICILPPLNFVTCVRCIWSLKSGQQVPVPGPPSSHSSENSTMAEWSCLFPFSSLSPSPYLLMMLSLITYSPSSSLFSYSTSLLSALFCRQYLSETKILKVQIIWNWIRSCSLKEILHTYLLHFYWGILMMFGLSARHSPRGRPSNRLTFYDPNSASKGWRQRSTVHWLIDWLKSVAYSKLFFELSRMPTQWSIYIYHHMHICTNKCFSTQII